MGLLCLGPCLCFIFGRKVGMLSCTEIWYRDRAFRKSLFAFSCFSLFMFPHHNYSSFLYGFIASLIKKNDLWSPMQRTKDLDTIDLLEQLPALQQLLHRAIGCQVLLCLVLLKTSNTQARLFGSVIMSIKSSFILCNVIILILIFLMNFSNFLQPEGAAVHNHVIQLALSIVCETFPKSTRITDFQFSSCGTIWLS